MTQGFFWRLLTIGEKLWPPTVRRAGKMPLTQEALEEIQAECMAEDIAIDFARMQSWNAERARDYFESGGQESAASLAASAIPSKPAAPLSLPRVSDELFKKWFPKRTLFTTTKPKFRLICFHSAGSSESIFSGRGVRIKTDSPFVTHCKSKQGELLACELPGREARRTEPRFTNLPTAAEALFKVIAPLLLEDTETPYVLIGHSVGSWLLFELLKLIVSGGVPEPAQLVISSFPAPSLPTSERPWRAQRQLGEAAFKDECRRWDSNELIFQDSLWEHYGPLMRDDFTLFDEYVYEPPQAPFKMPIQAYVAQRDQKVTEKHLRNWAGLTSAHFSLESVPGHHLFFYDYPVRNEWMDNVIAALPESCR